MPVLGFSRFALNLPQMIPVDDYGASVVHGHPEDFEHASWVNTENTRGASVFADHTVTDTDLPVGCPTRWSQDARGCRGAFSQPGWIYYESVACGRCVGAGFLEWVQVQAEPLRELAGVRCDFLGVLVVTAGN